MLGKAWNNMLNIDTMGLSILILAGLISYGAKFIVINILKVPEENAFKSTIIIKVIGLVLGLLGLFKITGSI